MFHWSTEKEYYTPSDKEGPHLLFIRKDLSLNMKLSIHPPYPSNPFYWIITFSDFCSIFNEKSWKLYEDSKYFMFDVIMSSKMNETIILIEFVSQLYALTIKARYKIVKLLSNGNTILKIMKKSWIEITEKKVKILERNQNLHCIIKPDPTKQVVF